MLGLCILTTSVFGLIALFLMRNIFMACIGCGRRNYKQKEIEERKRSSAATSSDESRGQEGERRAGDVPPSAASLAETALSNQLLSSLPPVSPRARQLAAELGHQLEDVSPRAHQLVVELEHQVDHLVELEHQVEEELNNDCEMALEEASKTNPLAFTLICTGIIVPLLFFVQIAVPCWDCYDFEAAMLHEMGHLFGLGHPDNVPSELAAPEDINPLPLINPTNTYQADLAGGGRVNKSNCNTLWSRAMAGIPATLTDEQQQVGIGGYSVRSSVMKAFTQHSPRTCLEDDDVEAISTLYPDCSLTSQSTNVCLHTYHNIGLVRLMAFVLIPMLVALLCVVTFSTCLERYRDRELRKSREMLSFEREEAAGLRKELKNKMRSVTRRPARFPVPDSSSGTSRSTWRNPRVQFGMRLSVAPPTTKAQVELQAASTAMAPVAEETSCAM